MKIGLIDEDSHHFPNLVLMKLAAYHKARGDQVEKWNGLVHYDRVYQSRVFDSTYTKPFPWVVNADEIIRGGQRLRHQGKTPGGNRTHTPRLFTLRHKGHRLRLPHPRLPQGVPLLHSQRKGGTAQPPGGRARRVLERGEENHPPRPEHRSIKRVRAAV